MEFLKLKLNVIFSLYAVLKSFSCATLIVTAQKGFVKNMYHLGDFPIMLTLLIV